MMGRIRWIERIICLFKGHVWCVAHVFHYAGNLDEGPVLFEPPADYYKLLCLRCTTEIEREACEWFNQHGVRVDDLKKLDGWNE